MKYIISLMVVFLVQTSFAGICDIPLRLPKEAYGGSQIVSGAKSPIQLHGISDSNFANSLQLDYIERTIIACDFRRGVLNKYALIDLKKHRIGVDVKAHLDQCAETEYHIEQNDNLAFFDRMKKCVAGFQDTHFDLIEQRRRAAVFNGIRIKKIDGKYVIAAVYPKLLDYVMQKSNYRELADVLSLGTEVVAVEGMPIEDKINEFVPYVAGSSLKFREYYAAFYVFFRSFKYPNKSVSSFTVKLANGDTRTVEIPWWSTTENNFIDVQHHLNSVGIRSMDQVKWSYDEKEKEWKSADLARRGYSYRNPIFNPKYLTTYNGDSGYPVYRFGEVVRSRDEVFCYMQLMTFSTSQLENTETGKKNHFLSVIGNHIASCERKKLPLIFDLRANGGGYGSYPGAIMAMLGRKGEVYPGGLMSFRNSKHTGRIISQLALDSSLGVKFIGESGWEALEEQYLGAQRSRAEYLPVSSSGGDIKAGVGFNQEIVVLVTPHCVSACDNMTRLIQYGKRGTLIGTHSNGTGAGFLSFNGISTEWSDSSDLFVASIPNYLFGVAKETGKGLVSLDYESNKELITENLPVQADIHYETTIEDVLNRSQGWARKALDVLYKKNNKTNLVEVPKTK